MKEQSNDHELTQGQGEAAQKSQTSGNTGGAEHKGDSKGKPGNHLEGQYDKQNDDASMRPSGNEENAGR